MKRADYALILGWAGSHKKQYKAIADWYEARGYATHCYTLDAISYLRHPRGIEKYLCGLKNHLAGALGNPPRHWIVHLFSNNGIAALAGLLNLFRAERKWDLVISTLDAVTFDSAPYFTPRMTTWDAANAYARGLAAMATTFMPLAKQTTYRLITPGLCTAFWLYFAQRQDAVAYMRKMAELIIETGAPMLFLSGLRDNISPLAQTRIFENEAKQRGVMTSLHTFDADHVQLYLGHREAYFAAVTEFLAKL